MDITKLSIVTCGMFLTPPGGLHAVDIFSPEVDFGDEVPDQARRRGVLLRTNPGNMLANQEQGCFVIQKPFANTGDVRFGIVLLKNGVILSNKGQDYLSQYLILVLDSIKITSSVRYLWDIPYRTSAPPPTYVTLCHHGWSPCYFINDLKCSTTFS